MRKTNKGREPTKEELTSCFSRDLDRIQFDYFAWKKDYPKYPHPLCDPEDWTPYPERWRGLEEYLYIEEEKTATINIIVTDEGNGGAFCSNCPTQLDGDHDPTKPFPSRCPKCNALFTGTDDAVIDFGGSDF